MPSTSSKPSITPESHAVQIQVLNLHQQTKSSETATHFHHFIYTKSETKRRAHHESSMSDLKPWKKSIGSGLWYDDDGKPVGAVMTHENEKPEL
jgi:signal transduction histidine kinase